MAGEFDKLKGSVKEAVGSSVGNKNLEADGKVDQAKGSAREAAENVKDQVRRKVEDVKDAAAEKLRDHSRDAERRTEPPRE